MLGVWGGLARWVVEVLRVRVVYEWFLGGLGWAGRCRVVPWVRGGPWSVVGACGGRGLRWVAFCGAPVVSPRSVDGDRGVCWVQSTLVGFWVMGGMVIHETQLVFPGGGVGELLCLCHQEVFAVYHSGRRSADGF